jgi:hypothetical protein
MLFCLSLPCLVLALVLSASAGEGRDLTGSYRVDNASADGDTTHLSLTINLLNCGDQDFHNGAIALFDNQPRPNLIGGFAPIKLFRLHQEIALSQRFDVPKPKYDRWLSGEQPNLMFLSKEHGVVRMRTIQLRRDESLLDHVEQ